MQTEIQRTKTMKCRKSSSKREVHSNKHLHKETRKMFHLKELEKEQMKPKVSKTKEKARIKVEINELKPKRQQERFLKKLNVMKR